MIRKLTWKERLSYRNKGPDARPLGSIGGFFQGLLSIPFDWKSTPPTKLFEIDKTVVYIWPPFLAVNIRQGGFWRTIRIGWRWDGDPTYMGYIFDVIIKLREEQPHQ